jgi:deoxyribodipyrimidine photolyase-related protein
VTVWLLGDQLSPEVTPLERTDRVLMIEAHAFADRLPYHPAKLTLLFSAMRHCRDALRDRGYEVTYIRAETFGDGLDAYFEASPGDSLVLMEPPSHGAASRLADLVERRGGSLTVVENDRFLTTPETFDEWAGDRTVEEGFRQERWYRFVRRECDVLMDGDEPEGGEWNYDDRNRDTPPEGWSPPPVPMFEPDAITRAVHEWVTERYDDHWGNPSLDAVVWPTTAEEARSALDHFVSARLPEFGDYQDAMVDGEWALAHSLLSSSLNLGLLHPREAVDAAVDAYESGAAPLNAVEGFVRQVLGWREFVRHVYRRAMPAMGEADQLDQSRELPPLYWDADTDMRCLSEAVSHVHERGYAHHIERLMVLSNFALVYGADPHELNRWFHLGFVDAYHWVTTPNVVGMGSFATDVLSSKPYASSGTYIDRMSDFCGSCPYAVSRTTGEGACPFNALYWDFLKDKEDLLRGTGRMGLMYSHVDKKDDEEWEAIRERAQEVRELAKEGKL